MIIQYFLADGQEIVYDTGGNIICLDDINNIAMMYARARPNDLPTDVYMHPSVYSDFIKMFASAPRLVPEESGPMLMAIATGCGVLKVHPMPWAFEGFKVLVGKREDYDRYDIDKIFEETVLAGCERE